MKTTEILKVFRSEMLSSSDSFEIKKRTIIAAYKTLVKFKTEIQKRWEVQSDFIDLSYVSLLDKKTFHDYCQKNDHEKEKSLNELSVEEIQLHYGQFFSNVIMNTKSSI